VIRVDPIEVIRVDFRDVESILVRSTLTTSARLTREVGLTISHNVMLRLCDASRHAPAR
jgi:hypothetical protein